MDLEIDLTLPGQEYLVKMMEPEEQGTYLQEVKATSKRNAIYIAEGVTGHYSTGEAWVKGEDDE